MINLIVAFDDKYSIGKDNQIQWHFPEDLINFKKITSGHVCIMGRATWLSLPDRFRPLPNRTNVVISKENFSYFEKTFGNSDSASLGNHDKNNFNCFSDISSALNFYEGKEIFAIGGRNIFKEFISNNFVQKMIVTHVFGDYKGDVKFPIEEWNYFENKVSKKVVIFENEKMKIVEYYL